MPKALAPLLIASALLAGCEPANDDPSADEGLLLAEASVGDLDVDRIHIGLFELDGAGDYATTDGSHTGLVRLRAIPEDGSRVRAWAFDGQSFVDEDAVETITVRPLLTLSLGDVLALDDVELELVAPRPPPSGLFESNDEEEPASMVVIPLIWHDADGDGALDFDFDGESEAVGALVHDDGDREITLTHIEFDYVDDGVINNDGDRGYRPQWLVWAADAANDPLMVSDWSTRWSATLN